VWCRSTPCEDRFYRPAARAAGFTDP